MKLTSSSRIDPDFTKFLKEEWPIADKEHYGEMQLSFSPKQFFLKAEDGQTILGILQMEIKAGVCTIHDVLVSHKHRGRGIGKRLMRLAEKIASREGAHKLSLTTGKNWRAVDFYKSLGYQISGERLNDYMGQDFFDFCKFL